MQTMNDISIEDIYEKSDQSELDIYIDNTISLKLLNKDYVSALNILSYTIGRVIDIITNLTDIQIEHCKENKQDNIITMTRYIDASRIAYNNIEKKNQKFYSSISRIEKTRSLYVDHIYVKPVDSININYDYSRSMYILFHKGIYYNIEPYKFGSEIEYKTNKEILFTQSYCISLINRLYNSNNININELIQLGGCIIIKALNSKKKSIIH